MNASVLALLHALKEQIAHCRALRSLAVLCQGAVRAGRPLILSSQLVIRSLLRAWTFDHRQHDAAEFTHKLLCGLGLGDPVWEARFEDLEGVHTPHAGGGPITLQMPEENGALQAIIHKWSEQGYVHALTRQDTGVALQLARNARAIRMWPESPLRRSPCCLSLLVVLTLSGALFRFAPLWNIMALMLRRGITVRYSKPQTVGRTRMMTCIGTRAVEL